ncbi:MAG: hypothetical protein WBH77_07645 [Saccharofermentanales bacterium]
MKKHKLFIILIISLLAVCISGCSKTAKIDPSQLLAIKETGGNGYGSVEVKISDYYRNSLINNFGNDKKSKIDGNTILARNMYFDTLQFKISEPNQNLSNGDVVAITIIEDEQLAKNAKLKLSNKVFEYQVSFLPELEVLDPFDYYQIVFSGDNGEGYVQVDGGIPVMTSIDYLIYDSYGNKLEYDYGYSEQSQGLSNGDSITLKLDYDKASLVEEGYVMNQDELTYTVSGLEEFEIVDEDILFESFSYQFEDASPKASMILENKLPDDLYGYFDYSVSPDYDLELGDKITITVTADQPRLKAAGKILPGGSVSYEYELTENIIPQYLSNLDDISETGKADLKADLSDYILKIQADYKSDYAYIKGIYTRLETVTVGNLEKVVLLYPKSSMMDQITGDYSNLIFIYQAKVVTDGNGDDSETLDLYIALIYSDLINYPGSGIYVDSSKLSDAGKLGSLADIEDEVVNKYRDKYSVSEISGTDFN